MLGVYRILTALVYYISFPILFLMHLFGSVKWGQRLGFRHTHADGTDLWIHASSMGEVNVVEIIMHRLKKLDNNFKVYITVMTGTGYNKAKKLFGEERVGYLPLDFHSSIKRFLKAINPKRAAFIETEIWPNTVLFCAKRNIPIYLANGRMSEKSFRTYMKFKGMFSRILNCYDRFMIQTDEDSARFVLLGADIKKTEVIGNLKFDAPMFEISSDKRKDFENKLPFKNNSRVMIAGSIRDDELEMIVGMYDGLRRKNDKIKMILVPRYLEKINELVKMIEPRGMTVRLYTDLDGSKDDPDILIVNAMGLLTRIYLFGEIAVVGGTFDNIGGHNILEPVWAGIPVIYGPSVESVIESARYIEENDYGCRVKDETELAEYLDRYFNGELSFKRKTDDNGTNRARKTVEIILGRK